MQAEPWYGVRLVFQMVVTGRKAYEERVVIVRADSFDNAILTAEVAAKDSENEAVQYTGYAMAFHIFDESGPALGPGVEVFSLIRESELEVDEYLNRFHDAGGERAGGMRS